MNYKEFIKSKKREFIKSGFEIDENELNPKLKDFQKYSVKKALLNGRFGLFQDCGLGKSFQAIEWAYQVSKFTNKPVLILTVLTVVDQFVTEGDKLGRMVYKIDTANYYPNGIFVSNYDQLANIDPSQFIGIILDESSILKSVDGATKRLIIESFKQTPYKLCCSATPGPNDHMELGNHSEFLGGMSYSEMLAMFFVHDGGETSKWRLRKHAESDFWNYILNWSIAIDNPKTLGFDSIGYDLPKLNYIEHFVDVPYDGMDLFGESSVSATELHQDLRRTLEERCNKAVEIIGDSNDEKHICPLQLETIQRIIHLYSNEGETVFSPFGGIGSEGYQALKMRRKSISIELKESYFEVNKKNHKDAVISNQLLTLF